MHRLAADENFSGPILRGVQARLPDADVVRIQDTPLSGAEDPEVLEWCATEDRTLLTHDERTMGVHVKARLEAGRAPSRVVVVALSTPIGQGIDEIVLLLECGTDEDWGCPIRRIPL